MTDTNQKQEDVVLKRMLRTKPKPHNSSGKEDSDNGNRNRNSRRDQR
ncbi:MAG: hypothetical protein AAF250_14385 [Pseudomonadota bacterium]